MHAKVRARRVGCEMLLTSKKLSIWCLFCALMVLAFLSPVQAADDPTTVAPPPTAQVEAWRSSMIRHSSSAGCYTATYPDETWRKVPCGSTSSLSHGKPVVSSASSEGGRLGPQVVGNGNDFSATVTGSINYAAGYFESISGVLSETGFDTSGNNLGPNVFALQVNANNSFSTARCNGVVGCSGWQQYIYDTSQNLIIEYWINNYGTNCPTGWNLAKGSTNCYLNTPPTIVPALTMADLPNMKLIGTTSESGNDAAILLVGSVAYQNVYASSNPGLWSQWTNAEFNLFGVNNLASAQINLPVTIVTRLEVALDGSPVTPTCSQSGTTGETNSLNLVGPCCAGLDVIEFTQSNVPNAVSQCACSYSTSCPYYQNQPRSYALNCQVPVDFYLAFGTPTNLSTPAQLGTLLSSNATNLAGTEDSEHGSVAACGHGTTNQCSMFSTDTSPWCYGNSGGGGGHTVTCRECEETGRQCVIVNGKPTCRGSIQ